MKQIYHLPSKNLIFNADFACMEQGKLTSLINQFIRNEDLSFEHQRIATEQTSGGETRQLFLLY